MRRVVNYARLQNLRQQVLHENSMVSSLAVINAIQPLAGLIWGVFYTPRRSLLLEKNGAIFLRLFFSGWRHKTGILCRVAHKDKV